MIRNRVSWGIGLMALLLTLGTAACGGEEPAVVQPPAPPPAPPPFQPQPVEVALGESGNTTLMTTEDGGFTLNGEKFESGGTVTAENGNMFVLTLADGKWTAAYDAHETMVTLGITEEVVTLTQAEDGTYMLGENLVKSGETTVTAMNGNVYTLMVTTDDAGAITWSAVFVAPMVDVMLGASGDTVTITQAEDGSYWLGDAAVMDGSTATAMNGNAYTLSMGDDGMWMATYVEPVQSVMLGMSGSSVMIKKSEDGSYWLGDATVMDGSTATAMNGNVYTLSMGDDGMWMATYVEPVQSVMLGMSGSSVMIKKSEDGSYWLGDATVMDGSTATAANGDTYSLSMGDDGMWMASYVAAMGSVTIGASGISIPAMRDEAGNWTAVHPQTGETVNLTEGGSVSAMLAGYTNTYMLSSDGEGGWTASYVAAEVSVALGTSGSSAVLVRAEDGSYWHGDQAFMSGDAVMAENGNTYVLMMADGSWSATFRPETMEIQGTGLMALSREADNMWDVSNSSSTLSAGGSGDITTNDGAKYRVSMMDGMLSGMRIDGAPKGDTVHVTVGLYNSALTPDNQVTYIADDRDTALNEANTKLTVAGENISLGDLLGSGMATKAAAASDGMAGEFVNEAVGLLRDLLTEAELYAKYQAAADDDSGRGAFDERLNHIATRAQDAVNMIFGTDTTNEDASEKPNKVDLVMDGTLPTEEQSSTENYIRAAQTVRGLNRLLDALSSADAFVDATMDGNNGVFENALGEADARNAFSANKSEYMVYFGSTASTRYGAIALKRRVSADYDNPDPEGEGAIVEAAAVYGTRFQFDGNPGQDDGVEVGSVGAFSYANVNDTLRARNLPQTGGAVYTGGTVAVTPAGTLYNGDMRIDVNFRQQSVFGRVSELRDKDNNLWKYLDSDVMAIYLPRQNYNNLTQFGGSYGSQPPNEDGLRVGMGDFNTATIVYADSPGFSTAPTETEKNARFAGRFIGADGAEITGTWSLGQPEDGSNRNDMPARNGMPAMSHTEKSNDLDVIYGSFGVTRQAGEGPTGPADGTAGGAAKTTVVLPTTVADADSLGATFEGDKDVAGILRLGKRSTGGDNDTHNDFELKKIFAAPGADPKKTVSNSPKHVAVVVDHIEAQRAIYVIYAEQVGGDSDNTSDLANMGRQNAWKSINNFVRDHIFHLEMELAEPDPESPAAIADLSSPLGSWWYPMTRNGKPDDEAALARIDALLAALDNAVAFEDALVDDGGGVFDNQPALDGGADDRPFPLDTFASSDDRYAAEPAADVFNRLSSQTQLFSLSTDYTRFGVWYRRETESAVHDWKNHASPTDDENSETGATSPGSYAYSWLSQSAYRTDRDVATYPSSGLATYEGKTLANLRNTHIYVGDAMVRVTWSPLAADRSATSTIVPIFSNFRKWQDGSMDRLMHDHDSDNTTGSKIVDRIVFRHDNGANLGVMDDAGKLMVSSDAAKATITYTDGTTFSGGIASSTFMAKFVGSSGDGPLGILGTWEVPGFDEGGPTTDLVGSFGADLTSFETLLP